MKRLVSIFLTVLLVMCMTACASKKDTEGSVSNVSDDKQQGSMEETTGEAETEVVKEEESVKEEEPLVPAETTVTIFYGNANADGYDIEEVTIPELTPSALLSELANHNVLPTEVAVQNFTQTQVDGKAAIDLDLSKEYGTFIETRGTAGEKMSIGSICNTFLKAYNCECIRITVAGDVLMSGHRDYPNYMSTF